MNFSSHSSDKLPIEHTHDDVHPFKRLFGKLKNLFQRSSQPQTRSSHAQSQTKSVSPIEQLKQNWHFMALILLVMIIAYLAYSIDWSNDFVSLPQTQVNQKPVRQIDISFAVTLLILANFVGLLEAWSRNERFWMDWWIAPVLAGILIFKDQIPHDPWLISTSFLTAFFLFAVFQNESQQDQPLWVQIDTTPLASLSGQLLLIRQIESIPYPEYIPVWLLWAIFIPALLKELFRTPALGLLTFGLGVIMALSLNVWIIMVCSILAIVAVTLGASQDWLPAYGKHRTDVPFKVGSQKFALVIPWDNILAMVYTFGFLSLHLYGNWAHIHLTL